MSGTVGRVSQNSAWAGLTKHQSNCKLVKVSGKTFFFHGDTLELFEAGIPRDKKSCNSKIISNKNNPNTIRHVLINVANSCNLNCTYCFAKGGTYGSKSKLMAQETASHIVRELAVYEGIGMVTFFGGEPMLNFRIISWITDQLKYKTKRFSIITNGTILYDDALAFFDDNNFSLTVSIDGPKEIHDAQRGKHDLVSANVRRLAQRLSIKLRLSCQITSETRGSLNRMKTLHNYFSNNFPGVSFFFSPVCLLLGTANSVLVEDNKTCGEFNNIEIDETFRALNGALEAIINKGVTSIIGKILLRQGSEYYCEKCDKTDTINYDVDGVAYPCHVFFGTQEKEEVAVNHKLLGLKIRNSACAKCWARLLCKICPAGVFDMKEIQPEDCPQAKWIGNILERIIILRVEHPDRYEKFVSNFARIYRDLHLV